MRYQKPGPIVCVELGSMGIITSGQIGLANFSRFQLKNLLIEELNKVLGHQLMVARPVDDDTLQ